MALFKKKQESGCGCAGGCCGGGDTTPPPTSGILVLGSGCAKCNQLEAATKQALSDLGINEEVGHVTDFVQIASFGVMSTPALVIDGKVVSVGKVLSADQIAPLVQQARG